jgi:hypothetical protein
MLHETAQELFMGERHLAALTVMGVVFPAEGDATLVDRQ